MTPIHLLLDSNNFTGQIPASLGLVQTLQALRLNGNSLSGPVPSNINNLTTINELNLANDQLTGPMPNLTGMNHLKSNMLNEMCLEIIYKNLSNNTFDQTEAPPWFSTLQSLTAMVIESGRIYGEMPQKLFSFPQIQQVILDDNAINGTLDMGNRISPQLQIVSFINNAISSVTLTSNYNETLILVGNPVCNVKLANTIYCRLQQHTLIPYSTSLANCSSNSCPPDQSLNTLTCICTYPFEGLIFRSPYFQDVTNSTLFQQLEMSLWSKLNLTAGSVYLSDPVFNANNYLQVHVKLFPSTGMYFNWSEIIRIGFSLNNQIFKAPSMFGTYYFSASSHPFQGSVREGSMGKGAVIGITVSCVVLGIGLIALGIYAFKQKKRAERAIKLSKPFASWTSGAKDNGNAPELKGAR